MKATVVSILALLLFVVVLRWSGSSRTPVLESAPQNPLSVPRPSTNPSFIARQIDMLAQGAQIPENAPPESVASADPAESVPIGAAEGILSTPPPATEAGVGAPGRAVDPASPDDVFLQSKASEFAYVEFKGIIGGKGLASLCFDPIARDCEVVGEGSAVREITLSEVHHDHVVLSYRSAAPLRKPRVDLDVEYKPMDQLTPEEIQSRSVRYRELFGNRLDQASLAHQKERGGFFHQSTPEEQAKAKRVYRETYGEYFNSLQSGAEEGDNREFPPGAPTLDESVQEYLDAHWPEGRIPGTPAESLSGREN